MLLDVVACLLEAGQRGNGAWRLLDDSLPYVQMETTINVNCRKLLDGESALLRIEIQKIRLRVSGKQFRKGIANRRALRLRILGAINRSYSLNDRVHYLLSRLARK
ncbi:hypothetical protein DO70_1144 [Burkholderia pseudomallei]|nr:hypothetical protein DO70_1144 [Burkholderia pseudomallei]